MFRSLTALLDQHSAARIFRHRVHDFPLDRLIPRSAAGGLFEELRNGVEWLLLFEEGPCELARPTQRARTGLHVCCPSVASRQVRSGEAGRTQQSTPQSALRRIKAFLSCSLVQFDLFFVHQHTNSEHLHKQLPEWVSQSKQSLQVTARTSQRPVTR